MSTPDLTPTHTPVAPPLDLSPAPRKRRRFPMWARFVATGIAGIVLGAASAGGGDASPSASTPGSTTTVTAPAADVTASPEYLALAAERDAAVKRADDATAAAKAQQDAADAAAAAAAAPAGLTNGQYIVGSTIEPGRYTMTVEDGALPIGYADQQNGDDFLGQEVGNDAGTTMILDVKPVAGSIVTFKGVTGITKVG